MATATPDPSRYGRLRWWPAAVILGLAAIALLWVWIPEAEQRQNQVVYTFPILFGTLVLLFLWILLFSRLRWKVRLLVVGGLFVLGVAGQLMLEFKGVSGDLVPLLQWRWSARSASVVPATGDAGGPQAAASSQGYPQFLGATRDGVVRGVRLARDWKAEPPRELWRRPVGAGWSGFAVMGSFAVTQEQRDAQELVTCYDVTTGRVLWVHGDETGHEDPLGGPGPRATPAISGERVFALGATGVLNALELSSGKLLWSRNILEDHQTGRPGYGVSSSPLLFGGDVVVLAGGAGGHSLVAYDGETGEAVWSGGDDSAAYSSPVIGRLAGVEQIVALTNSNVVGQAADGGAPLWAFPWPAGTEHVSNPVLLPDDRVFVSTGYGVGGRLLRIRSAGESGLAVELEWESRGLKAKMTNVVHRDGYLYGLDDGILACIDVPTGKRQWKGGRYGHGQVILVDDLLLVQAEGGDAVLVEATPEEHRELGRFEALDGKTWNHPALAGRHLLVRNDREAACFELPLAGDDAG